MRSELEQIALIERYLENKLTAEERKQFTQQLAEDETLQEQVEMGVAVRMAAMELLARNQSEAA